MPDPLTLDPLRGALVAFAEAVGGKLRWNPDDWPSPSVSVEWFQKHTQRGVNIRVSDAAPAYALTAYASTVKRGQKWGRKSPLPEIPSGVEPLDALYAAKTAAQAMMEKSFTTDREMAR